MLDRDAVLKEIDDVLARGSVAADNAMMVTSLLACIERNAPRPSYLQSARTLAMPTGNTLGTADVIVERLRGVLLTVRQDIEAGYLRTLEDRARDALSDDLLETASSIATQSAPAAVVLAVSVLEEHVRKLAAARDIETRKSSGGHRSFEDMTADLLNADVLTSSEKRLMGGWYAQRTAAAHGDFTEVIPEDAPGIIEGVRNAIVRHPS
jgi:hypothetical protein